MPLSITSLRGREDYRPTLNQTSPASGSGIGHFLQRQPIAPDCVHSKEPFLLSSPAPFPLTRKLQLLPEPIGLSAVSGAGVG